MAVSLLTEQESWIISCYLCPGPRHIILALNTVNSVGMGIGEGHVQLAGNNRNTVVVSLSKTKTLDIDMSTLYCLQEDKVVSLGITIVVLSVIVTILALYLNSLVSYRLMNLLNSRS